MEELSAAVERKELAGRELGTQILTQLGYSRKLGLIRYSPSFKTEWDLEYVAGDYIELIEVKLRRYKLHQFNYWVFEDNKRKGIILNNYERNVNAVKQLQIFEDGCHLMDVTKICFCGDEDYRKRDVTEQWQSNDSGGCDVSHRGSKYVASDFGYSEWMFHNPTTFEAMEYHLEKEEFNNLKLDLIR